MFQKLKGHLFTAQPKFNILENMFILPVNNLVQFQGSSLEDCGKTRVISAGFSNISQLPQRQSPPLKTTEEVNKYYEDSSDKILHYSYIFPHKMVKNVAISHQWNIMAFTPLPFSFPEPHGN